MRYLKIVPFLFAGALLFASCKKDLDQQPTDTFNEANAFLTMSDIRAATNTAYQRLSGGIANDMYSNSLASDEAKIGANNAGQGAIEYRLEYRSDNTTGSGVFGAWGAYYSAIDIVNRALPKIETVSGMPGDQPERDNFRAQLLTIRAMSHFGLLQAFSKPYDPAGLGVPISLVVDPLARLPRNTMGEVMTQIEADLTEAKSLFPAVDPANYIDTTFNKVSLTGLQARIALYKRDYDAAVTYSTEVINSGIRPLVSGNEYLGIWTDVFSNEVLFRSRSRYGGSLITSSGVIYFAPSDKLRNSYAADDIRLTAFIGQNSVGNYYVKKFFPAGFMKPIRTAEMYLIRAEANARKATPDLAAAAADLNLLRTFRIDSYVDQTFASAQALIDAIMEERFKELAFEGFRFFDLKRNGLPMNRLLTDAAEAWSELLPGNFRFVFPIPNDEILANPNMIQNDNY